MKFWNWILKQPYINMYCMQAIVYDMNEKDEIFINTCAEKNVQCT